MPGFPAYDEITSLSGEELMLWLDDVGGTPTTKSMTAASLLTLTGGSGGAEITPAGTNLAALQGAVTAASAGDTVRLTPGTTYTHADVWEITKDGITIDATGAFLVASDETKSAVQLKGDDITWRGGILTVTGVTTRGSTPAHHRIVLYESSGCVIEDALIIGSKATGVFAMTATDYRVERVTVLDTKADAFHNTITCLRGRFVDCNAGYGGDDGFAVVSEDGQVVCEDIRIENCRAFYNEGRGFAVVGGKDIHIIDMESVGAYWAGLYIAHEFGDFDTFGVENVTVTGGRIVRPNRNPGADQGAVLLYNARPSSDFGSVLIRGLEIHDVPVWCGGTVQLKNELGGGGTMTGVDIRDLRVYGTQPDVWLSADAGLALAGGGTVTWRKGGDQSGVNVAYKASNVDLSADLIGRVILLDSGADLTVQPDATYAAENHARFWVQRWGTSDSHVLAGSGVTFRTPDGTAITDVAINQAQGVVHFWKAGTSSWVVDGAVGAPPMVVVTHGATAGTARPPGAAAVYWIGSVSPTNAQAHDLWYDTSA